MKIPTILSLVLLAVALARADAPTTAATEPTTSDSLIAFRESGNLDRLMLLRTVISETELDEAQKQKIIVSMDETRDGIIALVAQEQASPSDDDSRKAAMRKLKDDFHEAMKNSGASEGIVRDRLSARINLVSHDLKVLQKGDEAVIQTADGLELSDEQKDKIKEAINQPAAEPDAPSLPPKERDMADQLSRRERFRKVLTDEQKEKWDGLMREEMKRLSREQIQGGNVLRRSN